MARRRWCWHNWERAVSKWSRLRLDGSVWEFRCSWWHFCWPQLRRRRPSPIQTITSWVIRAVRCWRAANEEPGIVGWPRTVSRLDRAMRTSSTCGTARASSLWRIRCCVVRNKVVAIFWKWVVLVKNEKLRKPWKMVVVFVYKSPQILHHNLASISLHHFHSPSPSTVYKLILVWWIINPSAQR